MNNKLKDIIGKSCKLFSKYGIKSVSMDDIAKGCRISKKTLYEHIGDKRDLVEKVLSYEFEADAESPHGIATENVNAIEALFKVYKGATEFFKDFNLSMEYDLEKYYPDLHEKTSKKRRKILYEKMYKNMEMGRKEGFFRDDFNIDIIAKLHVIKIETLLKTDIFEKDKYSTIEIFKELFKYHFNAIATENGKIEFQKKLNELEKLI